MKFLPPLLIALAALAGRPASAQDTLEVIALRHRTADQVLPALRPLIEPGGALSGQGNQIIVRTSPRNLAEIRAALEAIDTPARRLVVSVRFEHSAGEGRRALEASGRISSSGRARVTVGAGASDAALGESVDQQVQILEGGRAYIATLASDSPALRDRMTGFEVVPRLAGGGVILEIDAQRESPGALPGSVRGERAATTVSGPLGAWLEVGAALEQARGAEGGILYSGAARREEAGRIWVRVEELRP
ncbi:MAG TPA: secretin N-terminal domain-containing protein [Burkholderiales bacterium]|nr:secretin N-terminal domain-containing protein [Burkholderiales bacterium]